MLQFSSFYLIYEQMDILGPSVYLKSIDSYIYHVYRFKTDVAFMFVNGLTYLIYIKLFPLTKGP